MDEEINSLKAQLKVLEAEHMEAKLKMVRHKDGSEPPE